MNKLILASAAMLGLSGCVGLGYNGGYGGYGSGVSVGVSTGYGGYGGYNNGYGGYGSGYGSGYGRNQCLAYDNYGRAYYTCGYGNYSATNRYVYAPNTAVYYYPGYTYRDGYYYDRGNRRYDGQAMYTRHYRRHR